MSGEQHSHSEKIAKALRMIEREEAAKGRKTRLLEKGADEAARDCVASELMALQRVIDKWADNEAELAMEMESESNNRDYFVIARHKERALIGWQLEKIIDERRRAVLGIKEK